MSKTSPAALAVLLNKTLPCRSYAPCMLLHISASSCKALLCLVRSCNPLEHLGLLCSILHFPGLFRIVLDGSVNLWTNLHLSRNPSNQADPRKIGGAKKVRSLENSFGLQNR